MGPVEAARLTDHAFSRTDTKCVHSMISPQRCRMVRDVKITVSLPKQVVTALQNEAREKFVDADEYIRRLIIEHYTLQLNVQTHSWTGIQGGSGVQGGGHNRSKSLGPRSGYKGVYPYGKKWAAVVSLNGQQKRVAVCDTPEAAARAYDQAMVAHLGPRGAANERAELGRSASAVNAPYFAKLARGEMLSDVEIAAWRRASDGTEDPISQPVLATSRQDGGTSVPVRRQLRRGSAPAIERPVEDDDPSPPEEP